jgi:hypothetical protein
MSRRVHPHDRAGRPHRIPYVIAIALGAFLLFTLELLAGRQVLPAFGGAPAVWTTALCFFTAVLSAGYGYAHVVATRLSRRTGFLVHLIVAACAIALTLAAPADIASLRRTDMAAALNVLVVLGIIAGPAAFLLASTTPLLSAWYAGEEGAPWWFYAASNAASFAALLAYPFAIAPSLSLSVQRTLIVVGLVAYVAALIGAGLLAAAPMGPLRDDASRPEQPLTYKRQAMWLLASAVPAGLMSATGNFIQTDLIAAPLIWIGPLSVYLASFVVAFSTTGRRILPTIERLVPAAAALMWLPFIIQHGWPILPLVSSELIGLFVLAVALHGRLAIDRPPVAHLTRFYLMLSLGGVAATAFVALVAPIVFSRIYEFPLLIGLGLNVLAIMSGPVLSPGVRVASDPWRALSQLAWRGVPFALVAVLLHSQRPVVEPVVAERLSNLLIVGGVLVAVSVTSELTATLTPAVLVFLIAFTQTSPLHRTRTFFGVTEVVASTVDHQEFSGTTLHGLQFTDQRSAEPTLYFATVGPLGAIFEDLRARTAGAAIGVVGLGAGTLAAYTQGGDRMTFFEIDPAVIDIARNPAYFTYLKNAAVAPRIVAGDGRLSLMLEPSGSFDLVVLDAFTSDVPPAHLLTYEAMQIYARTLRAGGITAFHLSSRFYDLPDAVGATARSLGLAVAGRTFVPVPAAIQWAAAASSRWVVVGDSDSVARFVSRGWIPAPAGGRVLTDDYSDLTRLLALKRIVIH